MYDRIIWHGNPYAAFTSLSYYDGYFYCAFREANKHVDFSGKDCGVIRLIRSKNGKDWNLYTTFQRYGHDFRDPQLCITPNHQLMITIEDVVYVKNKAKLRHTIASYKMGKNEITPLEELKFKPSIDWNWLWQPSNINEKLCGFIYCPYFAFVQSGANNIFNVGQKINLDLGPTETSVTFYKNKYFAMARTKGDALLGHSIDGNDWIWKELNQPIGCPKLLVYKDKLLCAGRSYKRGQKTSLFCFDQNYDLQLLIDLSGSDDCAYPGAIIRNEKLYVTYYKADGNRSNIHFCEIKL